MKKVAILCGSAACVFILSCDESLPPYQQPPGLLRATFELADGRIERQIVCDSTFRSWDPGAVELRINVINDFDETLQGPAGNVTGEVEVRMEDEPDFNRKIPIAGVFDPLHVRNGILTLDPGDTLEVLVLWNHNDERNSRLWKVFMERPLLATMVANARIKPFNEAPELFAPEIAFTVNYKVDLDYPPCNIQ